MVSPKTVRWLVLLAVADVIVVALTVRAQANFHSVPGGPVTSMGNVLGWIISVGLFVVFILVAVGAWRASRYPRDRR